jgi:hypothetical protein
MPRPGARQSGGNKTVFRTSYFVVKFCAGVGLTSPAESGLIRSSAANQLKPKPKTNSKVYESIHRLPCCGLRPGLGGPG